MRNWTLGQLRTLCAVAEAGSMSAAAERMGYTVGAISQQMAGLQREAGHPLFIKDGRHLALSDAGRLLHRHAAAILAAEAEASASLGALGTGIDSTVRLGVFGSAAIACAVPAIRLLAATDPRIRVEFRELDPDSMVAAVGAGTVDVALGLEYSDVPLPVPSSVTKRRVLSEPLRVVFPGGGAGRVLPLAEITDGAGWLLPPADSTFGRAARMALVAEGIDPAVDHTVTDTALALGLAAAGFGLTVATAAMMAFHHTDAASIELPGRKRREIVSLARNVVLGRPSVARVVEALCEAGGQGRA